MAELFMLERRQVPVQRNWVENIFFDLLYWDKVALLRRAQTAKAYKRRPKWRQTAENLTNIWPVGRNIAILITIFLSHSTFKYIVHAIKLVAIMCGYKSFFLSAGLSQSTPCLSSIADLHKGRMPSMRKKIPCITTQIKKANKANDVLTLLLKSISTRYNPVQYFIK